MDLHCSKKTSFLLAISWRSALFSCIVCSMICMISSILSNWFIGKHVQYSNTYWHVATTDSMPEDSWYLGSTIIALMVISWLLLEVNQHAYTINAERVNYSPSSAAISVDNDNQLTDLEVLFGQGGKPWWEGHVWKEVANPLLLTTVKQQCAHKGQLLTWHTRLLESKWRMMRMKAVMAESCFMVVIIEVVTSLILLMTEMILLWCSSRVRTRASCWHGTGASCRKVFVFSISNFANQKSVQLCCCFQTMIIISMTPLMTHGENDRDDNWGPSCWWRHEWWWRCWWI